MKRSRDEEAPPLPPPQHRADHRTPLSPLHHAIVDWCHRHSPSSSENRARDETQQQIERVVAGIWPTGTVHAFGSGATGLNSSGGDIDLVILGTGVHTEDPAGLSAADKQTVQDQLRMLKQGLERAQIATSMEAVLSARVPLLKFKSVSSGLPCDVSIGSANGPKAAGWVSAQVASLPQFKSLCLVLKALLKARRLNEPRYQPMHLIGSVL